MAEHVHAEVQRHEPERQIPRGGQRRHGRAAEQLLELAFDHLDPRLDARGHLSAELSVADTAADHLAEHGDVAAIEVVGVDRAGQLRELGGAARTLERRAVLAHTALADQIQDREQQVAHAAEVVEDQRLVEASLARDRACARPGVATRLQRPQRRLSDLKLRQGTHPCDRRVV